MSNWEYEDHSDDEVDYPNVYKDDDDDDELCHHGCMKCLGMIDRDFM